MKIPQGNSKDDVIARRKIIIEQLMKLRGTDIYCPCLKSKVAIIRDGINETAMWASQSYNSTLAALDLKNQLKRAVFFGVDKPKPSQKRRFGFDSMIELRGKSGKNSTKIMVGMKKGNVYIHYCITVI